MSELRNIRSEAALNSHVLNVPGDSLAFFSDDASLRMLHEYFGNFPDVDLSNAMKAAHVAGPIVKLARLDALITTPVFCLREER